MCKITKNMTKRRGFTLIEILLVLAIMMMFVGFVFSTFYLVNSSHANVVVINDAKDFAALNMQAISKLVVNADHIILSDNPSNNDLQYNIYYNINELYLRENAGGTSSKVFEYEQYKVTGGADKWQIVPTFTKSGAMLIIRLQIIDSANTATPYYTLTRTLYLPNIARASDIVNDSGSLVITFKNF